MILSLLGDRVGVRLKRSRPAGRARAARMPAFALALLTLACLAETEAAFTIDGETFAERWQSALAIEDPSQRTVALVGLAAAVTEMEAQAVAELATDVDRDHRIIDDLILMDAWARIDPERAARYAMQASASYGEVLRETVAYRWATTDPEKLLETIMLADLSTEIAVIKGWYESGKPGLDEHVLMAGTSAEGQARMAAYASELRRDGGADALVEWMEAVRARPRTMPLIRVQVHRKAMSELAMADADRAIQYCNEHCEQPHAEVARVRVAERLGRIGQGRKALDWLAASTDANPSDRKLGARVAFRGYLRSDRDAALEWADRARAEHARADWFHSLAQLAMNVRTRKEPEKAVDWLETVSEENWDTAAARIVKRWRELDEPAAEAWLAEHPIRPEAFEEIERSRGAKRGGVAPGAAARGR